MAIPVSAFASSTPEFAVLIERLTLSIAANKSVLTPALVTISWKTVAPSIVDSTSRVSDKFKFKTPLSPLYSTSPDELVTNGCV